LGNCHYDLFGVVNWYDFLLNFLDDLDPSLNVRHDFWHFLVAYHFHDFLLDHWYGDYLFPFYHFFYYFLYNDFDGFWYLFFCFHIPYHFLDDFNGLYLFLYHDFLYLDHHGFLHFDYPLHLDFLGL